MTKAQEEKCSKIAHHYGEGSQLCILQEECAELIQAASKIRRDTPDAFDKYIDELADVSIMIEQMKAYMDDDELTTLSKRINQKLERQLRRIEGEEPDECKQMKHGKWIWDGVKGDEFT